MSFKELKNELIKNGGLTLAADYTKATEKNGFYVSKIGYEKIIDFESLEENLKKYSKMLLKNEYIGLWINKGLLYIDITKHYKNKKEALKIGIKNKQLAIFDIKNNKSIDILKDTYILYKYNNIKNDIIYLKEYYNINDIKKDFNINNIYQFINESLNDKMHLLKDKYIIIKDSMYYKEYLEMIKQ